MGIIIGIDGGGTKTRFVAYDLEKKKIAGETLLEGTDYQQDGFDTVVERLKLGVEALIGDCQTAKLEAISFGMPGYSEYQEGDEEMARRLKKEFGPIPCFLYNDVYIAFEGAFYEKPGILAVAGTGSLAYGRGENGQVKRCGGWSAFFGDEGSGCWIGKRLLEVFSKQSDGRREKSALYECTRRYFDLGTEESDFKILTFAECRAGDRAATAALNLVVKQAADMGDVQALAIYEQAVMEIAEMVYGLYQKLYYGEVLPIAVFGGLFRMQEYITLPLTEILSRRMNVLISEPKLNPCCGAIILAIEKMGGKKLAREMYEIMAADIQCRS